MWDRRIEKEILGAGIGLILAIVFGLLLYQQHMVAQNVNPQSEVQAELQEGTLEGYEEEEDLIAYMLYQIQNQNLDYALRGCAVQDLAEYFSMTYYIQYTEQYPDLSLIPPADYGSPAYEAISVSRLSWDYTQKLENAFQVLSGLGKLELLDVEEDVPENPDGKYYERQNQICDILGARSIREMKITFQTDRGPMEMKWSLARYKRHWKLLLFNTLAEYQREDMNLTASDMESMKPLETNIKDTDVLPCNYYFVNDCSGKTPEELVNAFLLYLQRQDVWSAMTFYNLYQQIPSTDLTYFEHQNQAAFEIQNLFYRFFLPTDDMKDWYLRDMKNRAAELMEELSTAQIIYTEFSDFVIVENSEEKVKCGIMYGYNKYYGWIVFNLVYNNGWKIESIEV